MSDEYGGHVDQAQYPRGSPYRKNPAIIDSYDPNEKPAKPGEGARVSDAYGAHYRDKNYVVPRGGVALSAHGIPEPVDAAADAENRARGTRSVAAQEAARREGASKLVGGIDYRGDHPEEYGKFYTNGYDFEGYYQGHHAGKKVASSFSGAGMHHKDVSDPYENFRGPVNKLEQKPMPKHNDMDVGVLAYMAPQNREVAMKPTSTAASDRLRRYGESQKILQGKGLGDADELSERLKKVGVAKNVAGPSQLARPSAKAIKALVPEKQEGQYDGGRTMKAKGVYSKAANAGNIEVGSVNGMVARADAQFDGIFDVNRVGTREQRADQKSNIGFKDGSLVADREGAYDGIFENTAEGYRNRKTDYPQDAQKSSIGVGMTGTREGTYEGIFENPEEGYRNRGVGDRPVEAPAKAAMQWGAERSKGRTDEGEGVFAEGHKMRGGFAGKDTESALGPGMSFVDDSKIDEGIFNANRKIQHSGKDGETAFGPGFSLAPDKVDDGIFAEGRTSRFAGKDNESNIEVGPGGTCRAEARRRTGCSRRGAPTSSPVWITRARCARDRGLLRRQGRDQRGHLQPGSASQARGQGRGDGDRAGVHPQARGGERRHLRRGPRDATRGPRRRHGAGARDDPDQGGGERRHLRRGPPVSRGVRGEGHRERHRKRHDGARGPAAARGVCGGVQRDARG